EPGKGTAQAFLIKAISSEGACAEILDQHIALCHEFANDSLSRRMRKINGDGALVAVRGKKIGGLAGLAAVPVGQPGRSPVAGIVAAPRALYLDDVSTVVAEQLRRPWACQYAGEVEYAQSCKR